MRERSRDGGRDQVFNMGGIRGEIIGSDRQRIRLDKGGVTSLSNRVYLGKLLGFLIER